MEDDWFAQPHPDHHDGWQPGDDEAGPVAGEQPGDEAGDAPPF